MRPVDFAANGRFWTAVTLLTCATILCGFLALLIYAFGYGIDVSEEASYVYLLAHPRTVTPFMDHFVWGALLQPFSWSIVTVRCLALFALLFSAVMVSLTSWSYLSRRLTLVNPRAAAIFCVSLCLMGTLLYFTGVRPTFSYSTTVVVCCNVFVAGLLRLVDTRERSRAAILAVMGAMMALTWLSRLSVVLPMLLLAIAFLLATRARSLAGALKDGLAMTAVAAALLGMLWLAGCDLPGQLQLISALSTASHDPIRVLASDARYLLVIMTVALMIALFVAVLHQRLSNAIFTFTLVMGLAVATIGAVFYMAWHGDFHAENAGNAFAKNPALNSLGPAVHMGAMAIFLFHGLAAAGGRAPVLQRLFGKVSSSSALSHVLPVAALLYLASLLPEIGTNTGLWHRSVLSMGPLFMMIGLFVAASLPLRGPSVIWMPVTFALIAIPVAGALTSNLVTRPFRLDGGLSAQTVRLDGPPILRGLKVSPNVAALQVSLLRGFALLGVDPQSVPAIYGLSQPGMIVLAGARVLGAPWFVTGYPNIATWNCTLARLGARARPPRIVGIDLGLFDGSLDACLPEYSFAGPQQVVDGHVFTLLRRKQP